MKTTRILAAVILILMLAACAHVGDALTGSWILKVDGSTDEMQALCIRNSLVNQGYPNADYIYGGDYPCIGGDEFVVFTDIYPTEQACRNALEECQKVHPDACCILITEDGAFIGIE